MSSPGKAPIAATNVNNAVNVLELLEDDDEFEVI